MASGPAMRNLDTRKDHLSVYMWDDEAEHPQGVIDMTPDGWSYIRYGPYYDRMAVINIAAFNFAKAANNFAQVALAAQAANAATAPTALSGLVAVVILDDQGTT